MSAPTVINEEYDIVIAGGEPSSTFRPYHLPSAKRVDARFLQAARLRASLPVV